jgi:hypothetical protein
MRRCTYPLRRAWWVGCRLISFIAGWVWLVRCQTKLWFLRKLIGTKARDTCRAFGYRSNTCMHALIILNTRCGCLLTSDPGRACVVKVLCVRWRQRIFLPAACRSPSATRCLTDTSFTSSAAAVFPRRSPIQVLTAVDVATPPGKAVVIDDAVDLTETDKKRTVSRLETRLAKSMISITVA